MRRRDWRAASDSPMAPCSRTPCAGLQSATCVVRSHTSPPPPRRTTSSYSYGVVLCFVPQSTCADLQPVAATSVNESVCHTIRTVRSVANRGYCHAPMRLKRTVKRAAVTLGRLLPRSRTQARGVVLCYHSVHPKRPFFSTTPEVFERHIEWLTAHCRLTSFAELVTDAHADQN